MRCLYCGKELALLKRLTGGAEFCSEAHRKSYQSEYNDLALSRLLQAKQVADPLPALKNEAKANGKSAPAAKGQSATATVESPAAKPNVLAVPLSVPAGAVPAGSMMAVQAVVLPAGSDPAKVLSVAYADDVQTLPAPPEPQPEEIVAAMWGPVVEQPVAAAPLDAPIPATEPPMESALTPELPSRTVDMQALAQEYGLLWANPVTWTPPLRSEEGSVRPQQRNLERREFTRGNPSPVPPVRHTPQATQIDFSKSAGDAMEILNQPRPPAAPPQIWQAPPLAHARIEIALGELATSNFSIAGFDREVVQKDATVDAPRVQPPAPRPSAEPVAVLPVPTPELDVELPRVNAPADAVTQSLPIDLPGIAATKPAKPAPSVPALPTAVEARIPGSNALPLRPLMVLGPAAKPVAAAPPATEPKPAASASKIVESPAPASRVLRPSGKKRSDVRVVPAPAPSSAKPVVVAQTPFVMPAAEPASAPANVPAPEAPASVVASSGPVSGSQEIVALVDTHQPLAAPAPAPTARRSVPSTLVPSESPVAREPELDLHLPELHLREMEQGIWARMPGAVKLMIAAMIVLTISGFAYFAMNSSTASATTTKATGPTYNVGQQINSGGWIEDWAPNDTLRRVTLLRGSQPYTDYRIQFSAQIQKKAIGWMWRGINPKNFYVAKIEKLTSGIEPKVVFARYAVIDGKNEGRVETELPFKVRVDTTYKVRFDAVGPNFSVTINGHQVAQWRDTRLGSGGLGLYAEGEEAASVQGNVDVFELTSAR